MAPRQQQRDGALRRTRTRVSTRRDAEAVVRPRRGLVTAVRLGDTRGRCRGRTSKSSPTRLRPSTGATSMRGPTTGATISTTGRPQGAPDDPGPIHGKEAMRTYVEDWLDTFDDFRGEVIELIDAGDDVIVVMRIGGRAS